MEELLRFRHRFRNIYKSTLDPKKMAPVQDAADGIAADFAAYHQQFIDFLRALAAELQE